MVIVDGNLIVAGYTDATIRRWEVQSGAQIGHFLLGHRCSADRIVVSRDGKITGSDEDGTERRWDAQSEIPIGHPLHEDIRYNFLTGDGDAIVSVFYHQTLRLLNAQSGALTGKPLPINLDIAERLAVSRDITFCHMVVRWERKAHICGLSSFAVVRLTNFNLARLLSDQCLTMKANFWLVMSPFGRKMKFRFEL